MERNALEALLFLLGRGRAAATFREATDFRRIRGKGRVNAGTAFRRKEGESF
jgi:hypothetical protein